MKTAVTVLMLLCVIPYVLAWISGYYRHQQLGAFDNKNPRQQYTQLTGIGARAVAAQSNSWEALGVYTAAMVAVAVSGVEVAYLAEAALVVLLSRVLHAIFYIANLDFMRSLVFMVGILPSFYMFFVAIVGD